MKLSMRDQTEVKGLCRSCYHRNEVISKNHGQVMAICRTMGLNLRKAGEITVCTSYYAVDNSVLFVKEAWKMKKDENGEWKFYDPDTWQKMQDDDDD